MLHSDRDGEGGTAARAYARTYHARVHRHWVRDLAACPRYLNFETTVTLVRAWVVRSGRAIPKKSQSGCLQTYDTILIHPSPKFRATLAPSYLTNLAPH